ncbi:polymorphic toxin-type HINT domain-containing protein [Actinosynnema sp. NPDC023658]|uniref:polymorphic toxin-type HINT domain-containing protein n=1 Tax=Actinosynnema sp. NPDC023658 TaxID=3155465 RepID=UPI0033E000AF
MADGTQQPIDEIEVGDLVLATDPETGRTEAKPVERLIAGEGDKRLVTITVDTDGMAGTATAQTVATDGHPFWIQAERRWVEAKDLLSGTWLRTSVGTYVQVIATVDRTARQRVHNLTVADIHTYYVLAGSTPVLVHNCGNGGPEFGQPCTCADDQVFARLGTSKESTGRLADQARMAEGNPKSFGHGVSVRAVDGPVEGASLATKAQLEGAGFSLIFTPTRKLPMHHTLILPKPVDTGVQKLFNQAFGRGR